jgi:hypothetical protein
MPISGRLGGLRDSLTGRKPASGAPRATDGDVRVITVLGMHRSGTSSLVGSLEAAGLPLGEVRAEGGASNAKGHREPGELISLHEDVLITSGGAWHMPPDKVRWTKRQQKRRDEFIASRAGLSLWGWKEPRTLLVIDGWLKVLPQLEMVGTFRHPAAVARSLQRRHGSDTVDPWLQLWLVYDSVLLRLATERGIPLIDFDLPANAYQARLRAIVEELRLPGGGDEFFDASLRTSQAQAPPDMELPGYIESVYRRLQEIAAAQASA